MEHPRFTKKHAPLRPIVASIGGITFKATKLIVNILGPRLGKSEHHIKNRQRLEVSPRQILISFEVSSLFTKIPVSDKRSKGDRGTNRSRKKN